MPVADLPTLPRAVGTGFGEGSSGPVLDTLGMTPWRTAAPIHVPGDGPRQGIRDYPDGPVYRQPYRPWPGTLPADTRLRYVGLAERDEAPAGPAPRGLVFEVTTGCWVGFRFIVYPTPAGSREMLEVGAIERVEAEVG
jgi:hypothetical protein